MPKRLTVVRAPDGMERDAFVAALRARDGHAWVTDPDPRPATAVVASAPDGVPGVVLATFDVDDRVVWDEPVDGDVYSMFAFFRWTSDVEPGVALERYREHADLARIHHPGIRTYVQDVVAECSGADRWRFDAISELHFAGPDEYRTRFYRDDASRDVIARDVPRFSDRTTSKAIVGGRVR